MVDAIDIIGGIALIIATFTIIYIVYKTTQQKEEEEENDTADR